MVNLAEGEEGMTRELDLEYSELCHNCKRKVRIRNMDVIIRMLNKHSYRIVSKLTGIPRETLRNLKHPEYKKYSNGNMSESKCLRTSDIKPVDSDNGDNLGVDTAELSKRLRRLGQIAK
jgi:hypothetical protein